jgi:hypothetical protein
MRPEIFHTDSFQEKIFLKTGVLNRETGFSGDSMFGIECSMFGVFTGGEIVGKDL